LVQLENSIETHSLGVIRVEKDRSNYPPIQTR
jgi:hypothetical protein